MVMLYFLVVNYNSSEFIRRLLTSLDVYSPGEYKIIIINNSPDDREVFQLKSEAIKIIAAQDNLGFGKACNLGIFLLGFV
jgi:N-acetylglucosaminyl-diphospho-decaprenol L-rhamnosyltransferase